MAPLASIPEANTSLYGTHAASRRPRSRVVFLARQPGPQRISIRRQFFAGRRRPNNDACAEPPKLQRAARASTPDKDTSPSRTSKISESPSWSNISSSKATGARMSERIDNSESSFDYESFPQPPSNNVSSYNEQTNPDNMSQCAVSRPVLKPPLALSQRKLLFPNPMGPSSIRRSLADAASNIVSPSKHTSVDAELVEAVSRAIAQQLRLVSSIKYPKRDTSQPSSSAKGRYGRVSGTSSHNHALNRFTQDLEAYADRTAVKGKKANLASTSPPSTTTFQTVSALMPFRSELRAAGLAVTSKDQGRLQPRGIRAGSRRRLVKRRQPPRVAGQFHPSQVDGNGGGVDPSQSTEISFAASQEVDEFRYALIDEAPVRKKNKKKKRSPRKKRPKHHCLPCFTKEDEFNTDQEWAHFRTPISKPNKTPQKKASMEALRPPLGIQGQPRQPGHSGPPGKLVEQVDSASQSPGYAISHKVEVSARPAPTKTPYELGSRPNFITTGRRYSMTLPKISVQRENGTVHQRPKKTQINGIIAGHTQKSDKGLVHLYGVYQASSLEDNHQKRQPQPDQKHTCRNCREEDPPGKHPSDQSVVVGNNGPNTVPAASQIQADGALLETGQSDSQPKKPDGTRRKSRHRPSRGRRNRRRPVSQYDPYHLGICCPSIRGIPAKAIARPNIPRRTSSIRGSMDSPDVDFDDREISDRDVLRGLHVAASAACNEEVDAFVRNRTGLRVRRFLADLMVLETLTAALPGEGQDQHARRRRAEMRKLKQQVRRSREIVMTGGLI